MKRTNRESWLMHAMFRCDNCDWEAGYFSTATDLARKHAKKTGHDVTGETGYHVKYFGAKNHGHE